MPENNEITQTAGWLGQVVNEHLIAKELSNGIFARVYLGLNVNSDEKVICKVSRPMSEVTRGGALSSQALMWVTGGVKHVTPDTGDLIELQYRALKQAAAVLEMPNAFSLHRNENESYMFMEYIEGETLSHRIATKSMKLTERRELWSQILQAASRMLSSPGAKKHADLKPDNIIIGNDGIRFIDPGYFGALRTNFGTQDCVITTPAYYPTLAPDDLLALGIIAWQIFVGEHPFFSDRDHTVESQNQFSQAVHDFVQSGARVGQHRMAAILNLQLPGTINSELSSALQALLLRGLRLQIRPDGVWDLDRGFADIAEFASAYRGQ